MRKEDLVFQIPQLRYLFRHPILGVSFISRSHTNRNLNIHVIVMHRTTLTAIVTVTLFTIYHGIGLWMIRISEPTTTEVWAADGSGRIRKHPGEGN